MFNRNHVLPIFINNSNNEETINNIYIIKQNTKKMI